MQERGGDERREREAAVDARASRDETPARATDHDDSADIHLRNARRLESHGAHRDAARERAAAEHEEDAADGRPDPAE